jgi:hypothetical protein
LIDLLVVPDVDRDDAQREICVARDPLEFQHLRHRANGLDKGIDHLRGVIRTVTPKPTFSRATIATRFLMTPVASSLWMRFQHGVVDSPTARPTSATVAVASC